MERVVKMVAVALTAGFLLQGSTCSEAALGLIVESDPELARQEEEALDKEREAERKRDREAYEEAQREARAYYDAVVARTGEFEDYEEYREELRLDPAFAAADAKKEAAWRHQQGYATPAEHAAEEKYYDKEVLGTGRFPSLEAYREAKKKDPAFRAAEDAKQAAWERKRAKKKDRVVGEGGGGGGGGGGGAGGGDG